MKRNSTLPLLTLCLIFNNASAQTSVKMNTKKNTLQKIFHFSWFKGGLGIASACTGIGIIWIIKQRLVPNNPQPKTTQNSSSGQPKVANDSFPDELLKIIAPHQSQDAFLGYSIVSKNEQSPFFKKYYASETWNGYSIRYHITHLNNHYEVDVYCQNDACFSTVTETIHSFFDNNKILYTGDQKRYAFYTNGVLEYTDF